MSTLNLSFSVGADSVVLFKDDSELRTFKLYSSSWAIRAMILYDRHLLSSFKDSEQCESWYFTLASYNGGLGWILKEKKLAQQSGLNPLQWRNSVELVSARASWAYKENRNYPKRIIERHQKLYLLWGLPTCSQYIDEK